MPPVLTTTVRPTKPPSTVPPKQNGRDSPINVSSIGGNAPAKRPSIFHSSDYDEDLENISGRFGTLIK